jgi:O-antigen/teichoic acid export membrane protein
MRGALWTTAGYGSVQALRLGSNLLLARWLAPEAFGVLALANSVQIGLQMVSDMGIGPSIIRHERGLDQRFLNTMWTLQIVRGIAVFLLAACLAIPLAGLYGVPSLDALLILIALGGLAASFASTSLHTLPREQRLARLNLLEIAIQVVAYGVMVGVAWKTRSLWSLAVGGLVHGILRSVLSHLLLPGHKHRLAWERDALRDAVRFGRWIVLSTLITFLAAQSDRLILGLLAPLSSLGVYALALGLALLPREVAGRLADSVILPQLARSMRSDRLALAAELARVRSIFLPTAFLISVAVALGAPLFFENLYDERYRGAAELSPLLVVVGWIGVVQIPLQRGLMALGHSRPLALANLTRWLVGATAAMAAYPALGTQGFVMGLSLGAVSGALLLHRSALQLGLEFWLRDVAYSASLLAIVVGLPMVRSAWAPALMPYFGEFNPLLAPTILLGATAAWTASRLALAAR